MGMTIVQLFGWRMTVGLRTVVVVVLFGLEWDCWYGYRGLAVGGVCRRFVSTNYHTPLSYCGRSNIYHIYI